MPAESTVTVAHQAPSSRRLRPSARTSSASPARLPRKCDSSISASGATGASQPRRSAPYGVAPEIEQDDAADEDQGGQKIGQHQLGAAAQQIEPRHDQQLAPAAAWCQRESQGRDQERQQIVDQPVDDEAGGHARQMRALGHGDEQHRLEHAEAGRHVADNAGDARQP